jgi:hypothetical protein
MLSGIMELRAWLLEGIVLMVCMYVCMGRNNRTTDTGREKERNMSSQDSAKEWALNPSL